MSKIYFTLDNSPNWWNPKWGKRLSSSLETGINMRELPEDEIGYETKKNIIKIPFSHGLHEEIEWHRTKEQAEIRLKTMVKYKIKELQKQIDNLKKIS